MHTFVRNGCKVYALKSALYIFAAYGLFIAAVAGLESADIRDAWLRGLGGLLGGGALAGLSLICALPLVSAVATYFLCTLCGVPPLGLEPDDWLPKPST